MLGVKDHQEHMDGDVSGHNQEHPPSCGAGNSPGSPLPFLPRGEFLDLKNKQPPASSHPSPNQVLHHGPNPPDTPFGTTQGCDTWAQPEKSQGGSAGTRCTS